jgi:TorA maturation chaperone TorD
MDADLALCRSALWEALALGFRPPTLETVDRLASPEGASALARAAAVLETAGPADPPGLVPLVLALGRDPVPALTELAAFHDRLFGHTARGRVPPYETEYGDDSAFLPQQEMSDLGAFLRAFGLARRGDARERLDHIACECEFLAVLSRKEGYAAEQGDAGMLAVTARATRTFLRDHVGRWGPGFGHRLAREDAGGFHGALGALAAAFVTAECRRAGVPAGPEVLRLRSAEPDRAPMACGGAGDPPR